MAHNLATKSKAQVEKTSKVKKAVIKTDDTSMVSVVRKIEDKPWHGLGTYVEKAMTSEEAIVLAGLDYKVEKFPVYSNVKGKWSKFPDKFATERTDTGANLGLVGAR